MDKSTSIEERIRRAEDISERRRNLRVRISGKSFKGKRSLIRSRIGKLFLKLFMGFVIYMCLFYIRDVGAVNFVNKFKNILDNKYTFNEIKEKVVKKIYFIKNFGKANENQKNIVEEQDNVVTEIDNKTLQNETDKGLGIGGENTEEVPAENNIQEVNQMEEDANYIKNNYKIRVPLNCYKITSRFGKRTKTDIVSENHMGIDLGAKIGEKIYASMDGVVEEASRIGDFGTHLKIVKDDVKVIYGHCSKLYVKKGDNIKIGQEIGEVGNTGKATRCTSTFRV